jgi:hypothetical protein
MLGLTLFIISLGDKTITMESLLRFVIDFMALTAIRKE